ncbi:hypothetical protein JTB14_031648 [Gonioctena quinquepunctata]|nr:hypothetical protein JTB14_031648 [Gonioctena quinquepunctata]
MALSEEDNIPTEKALLKSATHKDTHLGIEAKNTPSISGNDKKGKPQSAPSTPSTIKMGKETTKSNTKPPESSAKNPQGKINTPATSQFPGKPPRESVYFQEYRDYLWLQHNQVCFLRQALARTEMGAISTIDLVVINTTNGLT